MLEMIITAKLLLGAAAGVCLWFMVQGLIDMQRINAGAEDVMETQGVVRQLQPHGRYDSHAVVTLNVEGDVTHVDCVLRTGLLLAHAEGKRSEPDHALAMALLPQQAARTAELTYEQALLYQAGETLELGDLPLGTWRHLTQAELDSLKE